MNLGAIERQLDLRDLKLGKVQAPIEIPKTYLTDLSVYPKYYQGSLPACGAHSAAVLKVIQEASETNKIQSFSPRFLWSEIKKIDNHSLEEGTDMRSIFETLKSVGICDYNLIGNDISLSLVEYSLPDISLAVLDNAQPRIIKSYAFTNSPSLQDIKQAIYQNKVVLLLLYVDEGFFGTTEPTFTEKKWGHFVAGANYDEDNFIIIDSTEKDLSLSIKKINKKYIRFVREIGTCLDLPNDYVQNLIKQKELAQKVVQLLIELKNKLHGK